MNNLIIVAPSFDIIVFPSPIIILSIPLGPNVVLITSTIAKYASILLIICSFPCIKSMYLSLIIISVDLEYSFFQIYIN